MLDDTLKPGFTVLPLLPWGIRDMGWKVKSTLNLQGGGSSRQVSTSGCHLGTGERATLLPLCLLLPTAELKEVGKAEERAEKEP